MSNFVIDTLVNKNKQILVFVSTKRSAEAVADKILSESKNFLKEEYEDLEKSILSALSSPTKQCRRLARLVKRGVSFHHSGLNSKQRSLVEREFKKGRIKVICATPTLAAGVDIPAYRVLIRDTKRFTDRGMVSIPVLEYEQMSGRAGRPSYDKIGESLILAKSIEERENLWHKYVMGEPEDIISKLAVEPVLRIYTLSLIATKYVSNFSELKKFMSRTFYASQYGDYKSLEHNLGGILRSLEKWNFVVTENKKSDFVSANKLDDDYSLKPTSLGVRVSQLYLDPLTANDLIRGLESGDKGYFALLNLICYTIEMKPYFRLRKKDYELVQEKLIKEEFMFEEPDEFSIEYDDFLDSLKTSIVLESWIEEASEEKIYEDYGVSPGELQMKLERGDWLLYACSEFCRMKGLKDVFNRVNKLRSRFKNGVKEELLVLLKLKNIGRVRARKLFNKGFTDLKSLKKTKPSELKSLLGEKTGLNVMKQLGISNEEDTKLFFSNQ